MRSLLSGLIPYHKFKQIIKVKDKTLDYKDPLDFKEELIHSIKLHRQNKLQALQENRIG